MRANKYISVREHKLLLGVSFIALVFVLLIFVSDFYNINTDSASIFPQTTYTLPGLHFFTLFIFIALLNAKRFLFSSFLTDFYAFIFVYGLFVRTNFNSLESDVFLSGNFVEEFYSVTHYFDYLAVLFISILFIWQFSILLRMLVKISQKENVLP